MADGFQQIQLLGRVVKEDLALRYTQGGKEFGTFTLVVALYDPASENGERAEFYSCAIFEEGLLNRAKSIVKRGTKMLVLGQLSVDMWFNDNGEARNTLRVRVNTLHPIFDRKPEGEAVADVDDEDMPF